MSEGHIGCRSGSRGSCAVRTRGSIHPIDTPDWRSLPSIIAPPKSAAEYDAWLAGLKAARENARRELALDRAPVNRKDLRWARSCHTCGKLMVWDRIFLDPERAEYKVGAYLKDAEERFGGFDAVVLWHAYPRIGFDERNQFDFYRDLPGGLPGLKKAVSRFQRKGVRVFVDYNPWDAGTRREPASDAEALRELVDAIGADGVFLDTLHEGDTSLRAWLVAFGRPLALESELDLPPSALGDHALSWMQWPNPPELLGLFRNAWLSTGHMQHVIRRWNRDHLHELFLAWLNGAGMLVWENVFGSWNGWPGYDAHTLKRMNGFWKAHREFFEKGDWKPFVPLTDNGILASEWGLGKDRIWCLVNPTDKEQTVEIPAQGVSDGFEGSQIEGSVLRIHPKAVAAVTTVRAAPRAPSAVSTPQIPLPRIQRMPSPKAHVSKVHFGMARFSFPGGKLTSSIRHRECGDYAHANYGDPGSPSLHQIVKVEKDLPPMSFAIDVEEVTNAQFAEFLNTTGYRPKHAENFLKRWRSSAGDPPAASLPALVPPKGTEDHPVVYVDLDDARAYAKWKGRRLPSEWEWQLAMASGKISRGMPLVWNWTESVYTDGRTDFVMLKGGCEWQAKGSGWYADGGPKDPEFTAKFILIWPGVDRCSTIGFRCAVDLE